MDSLSEFDIHCPYCGESITVLVDPQEAGQSYIEDCQVCCKPIVMLVSLDQDGDLGIDAQSEDEAY